MVIVYVYCTTPFVYLKGFARAIVRFFDIYAKREISGYENGRLIWSV